MTEKHDCDWPQYKIYVLEAIESTDKAINHMAKDTSLVLQEIAVIKDSLDGHLRSTKPLSKAEIKQMIDEAQKRKNGNGAELSQSEVKAIVEEVMKVQQRPPNGTWPPWKYILLGAVITSPGLVLEAAKVFLR